MIVSSLHSAILAAALVFLVPVPSYAEGKSGVDPQVISLPKGPGSVEGLGESFEPQLNTGTATYKVKIAVSPGVNKHQPEVALEYNSGYGNSVVGLGWDLNTPFIQRRTDKGLPEYTDSDTFMYSRSGDLVPLADSIYRLKVEGGFIRFKKSGIGWEAWEKDGTHLYFGTTDASRLDTPLGTFKWLLERSVDTNGNEIRYSYGADHGQVYLDEIRYSIMSDMVYKSVRFVYESRSDAFSDYHSRSKVVTAKRLSRIKVTSQDKSVREYRLAYKPESVLSLLSEITQYGTDEKTALPPLSFDYSSYQIDRIRTVTMTNPPPSGISLSNGNADLIDIDGDSLPDIVHTSPVDGKHNFYLNDGNGAWKEGPINPVTSPPYLLAMDGVQMADMDGDGLADLFIKNSFTFGYYKNKGGLKWEEGDWVPCSPNPFFSFESQKVRLVDVNNDGLTDVLYDAGNSYYVWLNRKSNQWNTGFDYQTTLPDYSHLALDDPHVKLGDMNGDRMEDLVFVMDGYLSYFPSMGNGQFDTEVVIQNPPEGFGDVSEKITLADINKDGFSDLVLVGNGSITVWFNAGNDTLKPPVTYEGTPEVKEGVSSFRFADMNGDGFLDLLITDEDASGRFQYVDFNNGVHPNLLTKISNGLGMETAISYRSSTEYYLSDRDAGKPWTTKLPFPVHVVSGMSVKDLNSGQEYATGFSYRDGFYDGVEKEFRGFGEVRKVEYGDSTAPTIVSNFVFDVGREEESRKGMVKSVATLSESGTIEPPKGLFDLETDTIETRTLFTGTNGARVSYSFTKLKDLLLYENTSAPLRLSHEFDQDQYGNTTKDFNYGLVDGDNKSAGKDEILTKTDFHYDEDNWILDRPSKISKSEFSGGFLSAEQNFYDNKGNLYRQERSADGTTFIPVLRNEIDSYGNIVKITDANDHWRTIGYDDVFHTFPVSETIGGLGLVMSAGYDNAVGTVTSFTDFNGNATSFGYDALGRLTSIVKPGDSAGYPTQEFIYLLGSPVSSVQTRSREVSGRSDTYDSVAFYDGLGRKLQTRSEGTQGRWVVNDAVTFNMRKGIARKWSPYFADRSSYAAPDAALPFTAFVYDEKGRSVQESNPDATFKSTTYLPLAKVVADEEDNTPGSPHAATPHTFLSDGLERLVEVRERNGSTTYTTRYEYDGLGNLLKITDNEGNLKTMTFDGLGRKVAMKDPDKHDMAYVYDDVGNLLSTRDAKKQTVSYTYDAINRIVTENFGGVRVRYHYDSDLPAVWPGLTNTKGKLAWVEDEAGREYYSYDARGNTLMKVREAAGLSFVNRTTYDAMDRPVSFTYPDGFTLNYSYNSMNLLDSIPGFVTAIDYMPTGQKSSFRYANGVSSSYKYDNRQRLTNLKSSTGSKSLQDLSYSYDGVSNISSITDGRAVRTPEDLTRAFSYDDLYRLTEAKAQAANWLESYQYNSIGNMTYKSDIGNMTYGANGAGPHALTRAIGAAIDYSYDVNGNMTAKTPGFTYGFDHRDRMTSAHRTTDGTDVSCRYDYKGNRVTKTVKSGTTTATTVYADKYSEIRGDRLIKQIFAGDRLVARVTTPMTASGLITRTRALTADDFDSNPKDGVITPQEVKAQGLVPGVVDGITAGDALKVYMDKRESQPALLSFSTLANAFHEVAAAPQPTNTADFYLPDHLGSASVVTDATGAVVEESAFYPYGKDRKRSGPYKSEYRFTDKELDEETGLHYFGARYCDATTGRFISVDPALSTIAAENLYSPIVFNAYGYGNSNAVVYLDPDGNFAFLAMAVSAGIGATVNSLIYVGSTAISAAQQDGKFTDNFERDFKGKELGKAAVVGAISGAVGYGLGAYVSSMAQPLAASLSKAGSTVVSVGSELISNAASNLVESKFESEINGVAMSASDTVSGFAFDSAVPMMLNSILGRVPGVKPDKLITRLTGSHAMREVRESFIEGVASKVHTTLYERSK